MGSTDSDRRTSSGKVWRPSMTYFRMGSMGPHSRSQVRSQIQPDTGSEVVGAHSLCPADTAQPVDSVIGLTHTNETSTDSFCPLLPRQKIGTHIGEGSLKHIFKIQPPKSKYARDVKKKACFFYWKQQLFTDSWLPILHLWPRILHGVMTPSLCETAGVHQGGDCVGLTGNYTVSMYNCNSVFISWSLNKVKLQNIKIWMFSTACDWIYSTERI